METNQFIKKNWANLSCSEIGEKIGLSADAVRKRGKRMGLPKKVFIQPSNKLSPKEAVKLDKEMRERQKAKNTIEQKYKLLLEENQGLREELESSKVIKPIETYNIPVYKSDGTNEATPVILMSDGHFGETVEKEEVMGLNEYNPTIAEMRVNEFFRNALRIIDVLGKDIKINHAVLALLGDFINNMLFPDAQETNAMHPTKEVIFAQRMIASGIEHLLKNSKLNLTIVCHSGNHGRTTQKPRIGGAAGHSLEYLMYHNLAYYFSKEPRVKFIIPESYLSYIKVYDMTVAFHHGEAVRYYGGIGGLTIPMNKAIASWEQGKKADYYCSGHFHQMVDGGNFVVNGSIVGYNAYAIAIKARYERPSQVMFLLDKNRKCKTVVCPILFSK